MAARTGTVPAPAPIPVPVAGDDMVDTSTPVTLEAPAQAPVAASSPGPATASPTAPGTVTESQLVPPADTPTLGPSSAAQPPSSQSYSPAPGASTLVPEEGGDEALARAARGQTALANQVAGHAGVMCDESGSLVIKPALAREIAFYQLVQSSPRSAPISGLKPYLPKFYGTLALTGRMGEAGQVAEIPGAKDLPESIVLENLTYLFTHPSVLDAKLGTKLHAPDATEEKKARMIKKAAETTTGQAGLRLTGASTWHAPTQSFIATPRGFGYDLKVDQLPEGLRRFFPLPSDSLDFLNDDGQTGKPYTDHALPPRLTLRVLTLLEEEIARLQGVLGAVELRAVGASLLVVYEGDAERLEAAFERFDRRRVTLAAKSLGENGEDDDDDDDEDDVDGLSSSDSEEDSDDDDDGTKEDARRARKCPPLVVRLIDFAHTWLEEGEGPDEGVLLGLKTLRGLVQGRLAQVNEWIAAHPEAK